MLLFNADGQNIRFQPTNEIDAVNGYERINPNKDGEILPFLVRCEADGTIEVITWGRQTRTKELKAGEIYEVVLRKINTITSGTFNIQY